VRFSIEPLLQIFSLLSFEVVYFENERGTKGKRAKGKAKEVQLSLSLTGTVRLPQEGEDKKPDDDVVYVDDLTLMPKPIADLFPHTTVLFNDIAGFASWSSKRESDS
jgi:hypothetical protein